MEAMRERVDHFRLETLRPVVPEENISAAWERVTRFLAPEIIQRFLEEKATPKEITSERLITLATNPVIKDAFWDEYRHCGKTTSAVDADQGSTMQPLENSDETPLATLSKILLETKLNFALSVTYKEHLEKITREHEGGGTYSLTRSLEDIHQILGKKFPPFSLSEEEVAIAVKGYELLGEFIGQQSRALKLQQAEANKPFPSPEPA